MSGSKKGKLPTLPAAFCWTRIGAEAGQGLELIVRRKEWERRLNGGHFAWGIGNSILTNLELLVKGQPRPKLVFSRIRSPAQRIDATATRVLLWTAFRCGQQVYELPPKVVVTSRALTPSGSIKDRHYVLFCRSDKPLRPVPFGLSLSQVQNLGSLSPVGFSQVTAVVRYQGTAAENNGGVNGYEYTVDAMADLVYPYCAQLEQPVELTPDDLSRLTSFTKGTLKEWTQFVDQLRHKAHIALDSRTFPVQDRLF